MSLVKTPSDGGRGRPTKAKNDGGLERPTKVKTALMKYYNKDIFNYGILVVFILKVLTHWSYIIIYKPKLDYYFGKTTTTSFLVEISLVKKNTHLCVVKIINSLIYILYVFFVIIIINIIIMLIVK